MALGAATMLEEIGVSAEVVDPRTMWPLDEKTLIDSAKKTSRAIVLDEGYETLWRHRGTCVGDCHRRILRFGRAGETHGCDARSDSVSRRRWKM